MQRHAGIGLGDESMIILSSFSVLGAVDMKHYNFEEYLSCLPKWNGRLLMSLASQWPV